MLAPAEEEEKEAAGGGSGFERRAGAEVRGLVGAIGRQAGHQRAVGGEATGGRFDELPGRAGPYDAGDEGSAGIFGGRDCGDPGNQREYGKGKVVSGQAEDYGESTEKAGSIAVSGGRAKREIGQKLRYSNIWASCLVGKTRIASGFGMPWMLCLW